MPFTNRFTANDCGSMTFTGNTLGLSGDQSGNDAGTAGTAGAFITLDSSSTVDAFPPPVPPNAGTTLDYLENGSAAELDLPSGSTVLYAELIWGGLYQLDSDDITAILDDDILFSTPVVADTPITPDPITANQFSTGSTGFYMRSADVTALVQAGGGGTYSAGSVPAIITPTSSVNHAGWTLAVVYANKSLNNRSMNLYVGADGIVRPGFPSDIPISGFSTPPSGDVESRLHLSAQEGDAEINGDQALFGPDAGTLINLSGPRNPAGNFFGSQITDDSGNLDTSGSYGDRNHTPGTPGTNLFAGRQGWDISNVSANNYLPNSQSTALFRFNSDGDFYMPNALGVQIDFGEADLEMDKEVNKTMTHKGDVLTYTVTITNDGVVEADNAYFEDQLSAGAEFIQNTVTIDGVTQPGLDPAVGFPLDPIPAGESRVITYKVRVGKKCFIINEATLTYSCGKVATSNSVLTTSCQSCCGGEDGCSC
ncbi:DUF11 domain-containing protein [Pseudalkalibacillus hwajinpoensis]|uniref:DUF11 domain-containing protein n=1 Tax=Guptibacillus hwajinpoensis TaxID=208199 RepID=A0A4U1MJI8_9BACL|nr:DUF11 domain-containing protein [Pseudalkalibacillus hwajinpoensis]TKD71253.1 DUF11 domain-containing protein [Pseudalkalibacillus hwajinpoensis]